MLIASNKQPCENPYDTLVVGVGEMAVSANSRVVLRTFALGSCVGVIAYDSARKVGGLWHLMLPSSRNAEARAVEQPAKYADTGLPVFLTKLKQAGAFIPSTELFLAGGIRSNPDSMFNVGEDNIEAIRHELGKHGIPVLAEELGGRDPRTLSLTIDNGALTIRHQGRDKTFSMSPLPTKLCPYLRPQLSLI